MGRGALFLCALLSVVGLAIGQCPAACSHCVGDVCVKVCDGSSSNPCTLACPAGWNCRMRCDQCDGREVTCSINNQGKYCQFFCENPRICRDSRLICNADSGASCLFKCSGNPQGCQNADLLCTGRPETCIVSDCGGSRCEESNFYCQGITCDPQYSTLKPVSYTCGDGIVSSEPNGFETCDDSNRVAGDGCDEHCYRTCATLPPPRALVSPIQGVLLGPTQTTASVTFQRQAIAPAVDPLCGCTEVRLRLGDSPAPIEDSSTIACTGGGLVSFPRSLSPGFWDWTIEECNSYGCSMPSSSPQERSLCVRSLPSIPQPISPTSSTTSLQPVFSWNLPGGFGVSCAISQTNSFKLWISMDPNFADIDESFDIAVQQGTPQPYVFDSAAESLTLSAGTWYWKVDARSGDLVSASQTITLSVCQVIAPLAPQIIHLDDVVLPDFTLSWVHTDFGIACSAGATNQYIVYLGNPPIALPPLPDSAENLAITGYSTGTKEWYVKASNGDQSTPSVLESFVVCEPLAPGVPQLSHPSPGELIIQPVNGVFSYSYTWQPGTTGVTCFGPNEVKFTIKRGTSSPPQEVVQTDLTGSMWNMQATLPDNTYYWQLIADNGLESTSSINQFSVCTLRPPSQIITDISPSNGATNVLIGTSFSWGPPSDSGEDCGTGVGLRYRVRINTGNWVELTIPTFTLQTQLPAGPIHDWTVQPFRKRPTGDIMGQASTSSFTVCYPEDPQVELIYPAAGANQIPLDFTFTWTVVLGSTCGYVGNSTVDLSYWRTGEAEPVTPQYPAVSSDSQAITGFSEGNWNWKISASNGFKSSMSIQSFSSSAVCVNSNPDQPSGLSPSGTIVTSASTLLQWASGSFGINCDGATNRYQIYGDFNLQNPTTMIADVATPFTTSPMFTQVGTFYWRVIATNGNSQASSVVRFFEVCFISPPNQPQLQSPGDGSQNVPVKTLLRWDPVTDWGVGCIEPANTYTVLLSTDPTPEQSIHITSQTQFNTTELNLTDQLYYWQVIASNGGSSIPSDIWQFTTCTPQAPLLPSTASPQNGAPNVGSNMTFTWESATGGNTCGSPQALQYRIYLSQSDVSIPLVETTNTNSYSPPPLGVGEWFWQLDVSNGVVTSEKTALSRFTVCVQQAPAILSITPSNGTYNPPSLNKLQWSFQSSGSGCGVPFTSTVSFSTSNPPDFLQVKPFALTDSLDIVPGGVGTYYWSLRTSNGFVSSDSGIQQFFLCEPSVPTTTMLLEPQNNVTNERPDVVLSWAPADFGETCGDIGLYKLYLGQSPNPPLYADIPQSSSSVSFDLDAGWWWWKIRTANKGLRSEFTETRSFHVCRSTKPDVPTLYQPLQASFNLPQSVLFTFQTVEYFGIICEGRGEGVVNRMELLLDSNPVPSTIVATLDPEQNQTSRRRNGLAPASILMSALTTGQYYWRIRAVNSDNVVANSEIRTFTVCVDTEPNVPVLLTPGDASLDTPTDLHLGWVPLNHAYGDFGVVCNPNLVNRQLTVFLDTVNPPQQASALLVQTAYSLPQELQLNTNYWWYIKADNGVFSVNSSIFHFRTKEFSCINTVCSNGICNDTEVIPICTCFDGWSGAGCVQALCEQGCVNGLCEQPGKCFCDEGYGGVDCSQGSGLGAGGIAAIVVFSLLAIILIPLLLGVMIFLRKRKEKQLILLAPPDYEALRFSEVSPKNCIIMNPAKPQTWVALEELLLREDYVLVHSLLDSIAVGTDGDVVAKTLVYIFQHAGKSVELVNELIDRDLSEATDRGTLFRANTVSSKTFKFVARMFALPYLFSTLGRPLFDIYREMKAAEQLQEEIMEAKEKNEGSLGAEMFVIANSEINPDIMQEGSDEDLNILELQLKCQKILSQITLSYPQLPSQLCLILQHIKQSLSENMPDSVGLAVGNFLFLRFINPAILNPETFGLCESWEGRKVSDQMRRVLVLVTKVLQNLANEQAFGKKEAFMEPLNDFIIKNKPKLATFYSNIFASEGSIPEQFSIPADLRHNSLSVLHNQLVLNKGKVVAALEKRGHNEITENLNAIMQRIAEEWTEHKV